MSKISAGASTLSVRYDSASKNLHMGDIRNEEAAKLRRPGTRRHFPDFIFRTQMEP